MIIIMEAGKEFSSWESFMHALEQYSKEHKVVYIVGTCKTIETANKHDSLQNKFPIKFKYCFARMFCKHYGNYSSRSTGLRPHQRTCKTGCTSSILVSVNKKRTSLVIQEANLQHTHDVSENIFSRYPQNRRLQGEERCMASVLLRSGVPLCRVQEFISSTYNKAPTIKDLQNIKTSMKLSLPEKESNEFAFLSDLDQLMAEDHESIVEMINFTLAPGAIYIQTSEMTDRMKSLPDGLLQIVTHYINDRKISVISVIGIDGVLNPHILAFCIIIDNAETAFRYFLEAFVRNNPAFCDLLRGIVLDCSKENADFLQQLIPQTLVAWSRSYILEKFAEEVKNSTQRNMQLCKELMNASSKELYEKKLKELLASIPSIDSKDFLRTWDLCKELWAQYEISSHDGLQHQKSAVEMDYINFFKAFVRSHMSLSELIRALLKLNRNEEPEEIGQETIAFNIDPSCEHYQHLCFPEASQAVICQLSIALSSVYEFKEQTDMIFVKKKDAEDEYILDISGSKCTCRYFLDTGLPCQHIFAWLYYSNKPLYNELLIPPKWQVFGKSITLDALAESLAQGHVPSSRQHDERLKELQTVLKDTLSSCCSHSYEQMGKDLVLLKQIYSVMRNNLAHNAKLVVNEEEKSQHETLPDNTSSVVPTPRRRGRPSKKDKLQELNLQTHQEKSQIVPQKIQTPPLSMRHNLRANIKHKFVTRDLRVTSEENSNTSCIPAERMIKFEGDKAVSAILSEDRTELLRIIAPKTGSVALGQLMSIDPECEAPLSSDILSTSLGERKDKKASQRASGDDDFAGVTTPRRLSNDRSKHHVNSSQRRTRHLSGSSAGIKRSYSESQNDSSTVIEEIEDGDEEEMMDEAEDDRSEEEDSDEETDMDSKRAQTLKIIESFLLELPEKLIKEVMYTASILESPEERCQGAKDESLIDSNSAPDVLIRACQSKVECVDFITEHIKRSFSGYDKYAYQVAASIICQAFHTHVPISDMLQSVSAWPSHLPDHPSSRLLDVEIALATGQTLTVCGHKLNQLDMDTLKLDREISPKILHAYLELIAQKHSGKMFVIPFDVILEWRDGRFSQNIFRKVHFKTFELLVLPIHCGAEFTEAERKSGDIVAPCWMALVADVKRRTVGMINPRTEDKYVIAANGYMLQWRRYMQIRSVHTGEMLSSWSTRQIECSNIAKDMNSGILLLMNVEALINGVPPVIMTEAHITNYFLYIAVALRDMDRETTVLCIGGPECQQLAARDADWLQCENCHTWWHQACARHPDRSQPFYCSPCLQRIAAVGGKRVLMVCDDAEEEEDEEEMQAEYNQKDADRQADVDHELVQNG